MNPTNYSNIDKTNDKYVHRHNSEVRLPSLYGNIEGDKPIKGLYDGKLTFPELVSIANELALYNHEFQEKSVLNIILAEMIGGTTQHNIIKPSIFFPMDVDIKGDSNIHLQGELDLVDEIIEFLKPYCLYIAKSSSGIGFFFLTPVFGLDNIGIDIRGLRQDVGVSLEDYFNDLIYAKFGIRLDFDDSQYHYRKIRRFGSPQYDSNGEFVETYLNEDCFQFEIENETIEEYAMIQHEITSTTSIENKKLNLPVTVNLNSSDKAIVYNFNASYSCKEILSDAYTAVNDIRMNRIGGNSNAISLQTRANTYYNYNPNDPFYDDRIGNGAYRPFDAFRLIHHKGNYTEAVKALRNNNNKKDKYV